MGVAYFDFYRSLKESFPHTPTLQQDVALQQISQFLLNPDRERQIFLLKGYAGTGKTTLINTLVKSLPLLQMKSVLLAPTGRAAKVVREYTHHPAFTIHKYIYYPKANGGQVVFQPKKNKSSQTLFVVDEASMLSDFNLQEKGTQPISLLEDLIHYVYSGKGCSLLLIGDTAQLPPVHMENSPALEARHLEFQFQKEVIEIQLNEVVRQATDSGILYNATQIRVQLDSDIPQNFLLQTQSFKDIVALNSGSEIQETLQDCFQQEGVGQTNFIVRSNKRAVLYNQQIRRVILGYEEELVTGDLLMVVRNNYFWLKPSSDAGFIANGDTIEILQIHHYKELYGFRFAEVTVKMTDYPNQPPFQTVLLLNTLSSQTPSLSFEESHQLYEQVKLDYQNETSNYRKYLKIKNNPFFNALQVKYSYAVTCHKSQGGQWHSVFIEKPYLPEGINKDYLRWLYTALTRAQQRIYLIGFKNEDFQDF